MKINPYILIIALIIFLPSEDFLLKWLPVSETIYSLSRFFSEIFIYSLFLIIILNKIRKGTFLKKTPIDFPLILFLIIGIFSIFYNHAPILGGLLGIRTLLRYIVVYYILVNININKKFLIKTIYIIIFMSGFESIVSIYQHFFGISNFWLPRETNLEIAGYKKEFTVLTSGIEQGAVIGTLGHSVNLALFLLIQYIFLLVIIFTNFSNLKLKFVFYILFIINFLALLFTYSRGAIIASFIAFFLVLVINKRKILLFTFLSLITYLTFLFSIINIHVGTSYTKVKKEYVNPIDNIRMIFSSEYLEATEGSRQWVLQEIGGFLLKNTVLIGLSPDEFTAREKIAKLSKGTLERILYYKAFEDVYWVAILAYFGIVGLLLYLLILYKLYTSAKFVIKYTKNYIYIIFSQTLIVLLIVTIPLTFIVRTFEFRAFGFYFWLIAGIVMNEYIRLKRNTNEDTANK